MPNELKQMMAAELRRDLEGSPNLLVIGLQPMDATGNFELRNKLRAKGARLRVIHNRTSQHALDEARRPLGEFFQGATGLTLVPGAHYDFASGSSLAAAQASAVVALMLATDRRLDAAQVLRLLARTSHPVRGPAETFTSIDACAALVALQRHGHCAAATAAAAESLEREAVRAER